MQAAALKKKNSSQNKYQTHRKELFDMLSYMTSNFKFSFDHPFSKLQQF